MENIHRPQPEGLAFMACWKPAATKQQVAFAVVLVSDAEQLILHAMMAVHHLRATVIHAATL